MRSRHARDNCRHIESQLPAVRVFSGHFNLLIAADRRNDSERTDDLVAHRASTSQPTN